MKKNTIYIHFAFRKPRDEKYGIFSFISYIDKEFKHRVAKHVTSDILWDPSDQYMNSIQSYYKALEYIYKNQADLMKHNVDEVVLVTPNSHLVNWILSSSSKGYSKAVDDVCKPFRFGAPKEIVIGVGLHEPIIKDRAKRYCTEENADNIKIIKDKLASVGKPREYLHKANTNKTVFDLLEKEKIETLGIKEI